MAEIKRLNYFTNQFLLEKDFDDEQAYHVQMRRKHNSLLHTPGIADGLAVSFLDGGHVHITAGTAIDSTGREIVLAAAVDYQMSIHTANAQLFLAIGYHEDFDDVDHYTQGGVDNFIRVTERPQITDSVTAPAADAGVVLARITLNASGNIQSGSSIDTSVRVLAGAKLTPGSVGTTQLADNTVGLTKLVNNAVDNTKLADNAVTLNKILNNAVDGTKLADGAVSLGKLAPALQVVAEKLSGKFISATFSVAPPALTIVSGREFRNKLFHVQGWSASAVDQTPTNLNGSTNIKAWDITTIPHKAAYAICKSTAPLPQEVALFTFTEGTNSVTYKLQFTTDNKVNLTVTTSPTSFGTSYAFQVTWLE
jgi:hypothetical protein